MTYDRTLVVEVVIAVKLVCIHSRSATFHILDPESHCCGDNAGTDDERQVEPSEVTMDAKKEGHHETHDEKGGGVVAVDATAAYLTGVRIGAVSRD